MSRTALFLMLVFALYTPVRAEFVGADLPLEDQASVDGWSGIHVMFGRELPPGEAVNVVRYYADDDRAFEVENELYHFVPLIVKQEGGSLEGDGIFEVWEVGPTHTPIEAGEQELTWGSSPVPNDGELYHPGALAWQEGVDDSNGGLVSFGSGGDGMHYFNVDTTDYTPDDIGEVEPGLVLSNLQTHTSLAPSRLYQLNFETGPPIGGNQLQAGDADRDFKFDQRDLVQVQIAAKYLTGAAATWGEGDWDGAPGGSPDSPPPGDGKFDQIDIIAALNANIYLTGPYASVAPEGQGDGHATLVYNPGTGELAVQVGATELTSINIDSAGSIFTGDAAMNLGGSFDNDADNNIFKATFGSSFGSLTFGNVAQTGLSQDFVLNDLTVIGSLAGGGDLGQVDLIYIPEPTSFTLFVIGLVASVAFVRRLRR